MSEATSRRVEVKSADMSEDLRQEVIDVATAALGKFSLEKDVASYIKKEFDTNHSPDWHCIVGKSFGSFVTHETGHFIYLYIGQIAILLFKTSSA